MIMSFTRMFEKELLENIAHASSVVITSIRAMEVDAIIPSPCWVTIEILLEILWEEVRGYRYTGFDITFVKFISKHFVTILRKF